MYQANGYWNRVLPGKLLSYVSLSCLVFVGLAVTGTSALSADQPANPEVGSIRCEIWDNLAGGQITDTIASGELSAKPDQTKTLNQFELSPAPEVPDACALRGYVVPPVTGDYSFFMSADDTAELYLSTDQTVEQRKEIASVPVYVSVRNYTRYACQTSKHIHLEAQKHYFIEALLKNEIGASHVSVGWTLPDGTTEAPIPGNRLMPAVGVIPPPEPHIEPPKLTIKDENPVSLKPGFHRFVRDAHFEWPTESIDMSYMIYIPKSVAATQDKIPLLIFLHGNGHQGTDLWGVLNEGPGFYLMNDHDFHDWFPMFALLPQLPPDWRWDTPGAAQAVNALIQQVLAKYPRIDRNRVYLSGLSMGGKGSWLTVLDSPDTFATVTTFSAVAVRPQAAKTRLKGLKNIHIICGAEDGDFAAGSRQMYKALRTTLGDRVQFTAVPDEGHGVWLRYYPQHEVYEEMMRYSK